MSFAQSGSQQPQPEDATIRPLGASLWASFANARTDRAFVTGWLSVLVSRLPQAREAVLLEPDYSAGVFQPVAVVPDPRRDLSHLAPTVEQALASGRPVISPGEGGASRLAYPVAGAGGEIRAVVVVSLDGGGEATAQAALREVHWAAGWLAKRVWEGRAAEETERLDRAAVALDLLALAGEFRRARPAAMAIVNALQSRIGADRISIGVLVHRRRSPQMHIFAQSHAAWLKRRSKAMELLETAMEEAYDQNRPVAAPPLSSTDRAISLAHNEVLGTGRTKQILTVPLHDEAGPVGALSAERRSAEQPFTEADLALLESVAALIGPVIEEKRANDRWIGGRIVDGTLHGLGVVLGPRRLSWKLLALTLVALLVAAVTVRGPFRIGADGTIRGEVQRAVAAPFAGFVAEAPVRAGDKVEAGEMIVRLQDDDLQLELLGHRAEIDRLTAQARSALAGYKRAEVAMLEAQIAQARAQADLSEAQLTRTHILAPVSGLVVAGDLSQRLGAPVQAGEVLFEIIPDAGWRVDIWVDERDLSHIAPGQRGRIALAGQPSDGLAFEVRRITPVAEAREGINAFRVEAGLLDVPSALKPGMSGRAKIDVGRDLVVWVVTRRLVEWAQLKLWAWQP